MSISCSEAIARTRGNLALFLSNSVVILTLLAIFSTSSRAQDPSRSPGWVVLPVDEYRALHERAFPTEHEPEGPPVDATLTRVDYELHIAGDLASGRATLTIDVLKDGWVRVPMPPGLLVREARLDGKLVSLVPGAVSKSPSHLSALLSHPGRSILLLDVAIPVASAAGEETLSLPSTASGITRASIQLPRQDLDLRLSGGLLSDRRESATEDKWIAYSRGNEPMAFTWRRKTEDHHAELPLRLRGSLTQLLGLGEDSTSVNAEVRLEVIQGEARMARIQVPANVTVNHVLGAMVGDWEVKNGELAVTFLEPVQQTARFVVTGETRAPREGSIDIPLLRLLNAERETGGVAVEVLGAGEIRDLKTEGLESADATDLGEWVAGHQSPSLAAFRFRSGETKTARSLNVTLARYTPQAVLMANVEEARYQVLISSEGKTFVQARYAVRNNQRNFLKITLPPGATLWSASLSGKAIRPGQTPEGSILLPLDKAKAGEDAPAFPVEVIYLIKGNAWNDKGQFRVGLPALDLPVSRTGLLVYHPPLFRVTAEPGSFHSSTFEPPVSAALVAPGVGIATVSGFGGSAGAGVVAGVAGGTVSSVTPGPPPTPDLEGKDDGRSKVPQAETMALLDKFRTDALAGKRAGILPIHVSFPAFGPSVYLVSELTGENQAPSAMFSYQRDKKAGGK